MSITNFIPIHVHITDPVAKTTATTTVVMYHDEAVKFFLHGGPGGMCSQAMSLRKVGATLAAMGG